MIKKTSLLLISFLAAASVFAWSKKIENTGNLGRTYISAGAGAQFTTVKAGGEKKTATGVDGGILFNVPVFKPNVNVLRDVSWFGMDAQLYFDANYSGDIKLSTFDFKQTDYSAGLTLLPYLNFETGFEYFKAIKPFGIASVGFTFHTVDGDETNEYFKDQTYVQYAVGGGVEFVITDKLSFSPKWVWHGNQADYLPCYQTVGCELTYWATNQIAVSAFWNHNLEADSSLVGVDNSEFTTRGDVIGLTVKVGFPR